jgi:hypothetical protein
MNGPAECTFDDVVAMVMKSADDYANAMYLAGIDVGSSWGSVVKNGHRKAKNAKAVQRAILESTIRVLFEKEGG